MSVTKSQLFAELQNQGFDPETYQLITESFKDFPEEFSAEDVQRADALLAEMEKTEMISAQMYGEMADALEKAADKITDASEEVIRETAQVTYDNVKLAQDLSK